MSENFYDSKMLPLIKANEKKIKQGKKPKTFVLDFGNNLIQIKYE